MISVLMTKLILLPSGILLGGWLWFFLFTDGVRPCLPFSVD